MENSKQKKSKTLEKSRFYNISLKNIYNNICLIFNKIKFRREDSKIPKRLKLLKNLSYFVPYVTNSFTFKNLESAILNLQIISIHFENTAKQKVAKHIKFFDMEINEK